MSVFLGDELAEIFDAIEAKAHYENREHHELETGVTVLPHFLKDTTDRNRTSPFAFTGNKFEFRMLGSSCSIAGPNIVINTIVAESLKNFADELEPYAATGEADFKARLWKVLRRNLREHKRVIFNGDNYSEEWVHEAARRGLSNTPDSTAAFAALVSQKSIELFTRHHVFTESELHARYDINVENFSKAINIEAFTMVDILKGQIIPAILAYQQSILDVLNGKGDNFDTSLEKFLLENISRLSAELLRELVAFDEILAEEKGQSKIIPAMQKLRRVTDELETLTAKKYWPLPSYGELLHSVI
jgi:glutamine synthetase